MSRGKFVSSAADFLDSLFTAAFLLTILGAVAWATWDYFGAPMYEAYKDEQRVALCNELAQETAHDMRCKSDPNCTFTRDERKEAEEREHQYQQDCRYRD